MMKPGRAEGCCKGALALPWQCGWILKPGRADGCCKGAFEKSLFFLFLVVLKCRWKSFFFSLSFELFIFERLHVCLRTGHQI